MSIVLLCLLTPFVSPAAAAETPIKWLSYDDAQKAGPQNPSKKFLLYFYTDWCEYCRKLEQKTFVNKDVADYINSHFIPVRINSDKLPKVAARYQVSGVPDLRFVTPKGEEIGRLPGYTEANNLLPLLKYIQTDSYLKMRYDDFLKQK